MNPPRVPGPQGSGPLYGDGPLTPSERRDYARLRKHEAMHHRRLRYAVTSVLLVLAFVLSPLAVVAAWANSQVSDTDRYVQTVAPLAKDPAVQKTVTDRLTTRVVDNVDVKGLTDALSNALAKADAPPGIVDKSHLLAGPLKNAFTTAVRTVVDKVVTSDQFAELWDGANRRAHAAVVKTLTGEGSSAVQAKGDAVVLDLGTVVDKVKDKLVGEGYEKAANIPDVDKTITLFRTDKLDDAQGAMRLLDVVGTWLPVTVIVLAALAVWTAPVPRVALMAAAVGIGVMMVLLLVGLVVARRVYLDSVPDTALPADAAASVYDTFVRFLRNSTRTVLVTAVITALAGYLYGPGRGARFVRSVTGRATGATGRAMARSGLRTGATGHWLETHRRWTTGIVIAAAVIALIIWNYPTAAVVALVLGITVLVLAVLAVLGAASTANSTDKQGKPS
ncbi:hypothetical protein B7P34_10205 [Streptosporangium nondiastaticum]|uniref:Integral membrane protein n=1 Tax=Streptosporangium nondiastaticum TaxID=35764 RepID=A0A9X7JSC9_9ACTN|nr:hypothetical protein [Streptosporangium nondiastaticum]PSJ28816.1 hypothetical protein B7P34_10205 [Streptosporangium nondiastaticum]